MAGPKNSVGALDFSVPKEQMINTAGLPEEEQQDIIDARNEALDSLEQRYAQPNWFKVSAGFLKPQLGGFGASLGSAFDAMGENVEQQRALAPTIAVERAKLGQMQSMMGKSERAANMVGELLGLGPNGGRLLGGPDLKNLPKIITPEILKKIPGAIAHLVSIGEVDKADALKATLEANSSTTSTRANDTQTQIAAQDAAAKNPLLVLKDPAFSGTGVNQSSEDMQKALVRLDAAKPKDTPPEQWRGMGTAARLALVGEYSSELATKGMDEEQKSAFVARSSDNLLNDLTYLRTLAVDPKLVPLFAFMKNGDGISMFRSYLDKNQGNVSAAIEGMVAAALDSQKNADYETRQKTDKLIKGIARLEVNLRGSNVNPTNALQELNSMQSPSLANSQAGFVGILDQMGLQAKHEIDRHSLRIDSGIPSRKILSSPESRNLENRYRDQVEKLAKSNALDVTPDWYRPTSTQPPTPSASTTVPATTPPKPATTPPKPKTNSTTFPTTHSPKHKPANKERITSQDAINAAMEKRGLSTD